MTEQALLALAAEQLAPHKRAPSRWCSATRYRATRSAPGHRVDEPVVAGELDVRAGGTHPLAGAARAHEDRSGRRTTGKLLLLP